MSTGSTSAPVQFTFTTGNKYLISTGTSDLSGVLVAFALQVIIVFGAVLVFSFLRSSVQAVYAPKSLAAKKDSRPPKLRRKFSAWLIPTIQWDEKSELGKLGLDAYMYLRFLRFLIEFFSGLSLVAIPLIIINFFAPNFAGLPWEAELDDISKMYENFTGVNPYPNMTEYKNTSSNPLLSWLTVENVHPDSDLWYLYMVASYAFSIFAFYLLFQIWIEYVDLRRAWFSSPEYQNDRHNRILQVTNIPVSSRTEDAVSEFIEKVNPTRPQQIMLGRHFEELGPLLKEHAEVTEKFEILLHKYLRNQATTLTQRRPKIFPPGMKSAANCVRIDAFEYYKHRLHDLEEKIYAIRSRDDNSFRPNSSAFIQYTTIREAHAVAHQAGRTWTLRKELKTITVPKVKVCPDFDDIIWKNLAHRPSYLFMRKLIALPLVMFITIAWTLLLTVIITLTNLNYLRVSRPDLENANFFLLVLQYIVAPLSLYLLNYFVLPVILRFLTDFQGAVSQTGREKSTLQKFFGFLVYQNTYFIAISVVVQIVVVSYGQFNLWAFLQRYEEVVLLCTRAFVQSSTFYITTILVGYGAYAMEIVQGHYLIYNLFMQMFKLTPRQIYQAKKAPKFDYMIYYGSMCAPLMMSLAYCIVAPLVVPVSLLLYVIVYVVMKYQMRYVYVTEIETGGTWFEKMFSLVCFCLGLFQLVTCGAVALICWSRSSNGNGQVQTVMIGLLVPVTIGFWYGIRRILGPRAEYYTRAVAITAADLVESPVPEGDDAETPLDSSLFDPDMVSPLKKVWVESVQKPLLATVYTTAYENLNDFMTSKGLTQDSRFQFRAASRLVRLLLGKNGKTKTDRSVTRRITASEPPELQIDTETVSNSVADAGLKRTLLRTIRKASVDLYNTVKSPPSGHGDLLSEGGPSSRSPLPPAISIMTMHNAEPETESPRPLTPPEALAQELDEAFTPRTSTSSGPL